MGRVLAYRLLLLLTLGCVVMSVIHGPDLMPEEVDAPAEEEARAEVEFAADEEDTGTADAAPEAAPVADEAASASVNPTPVVAILVLVVFSVGLVGSLTTGLLVSEGVRNGVLLAALGPLLAMVIRGENATLSRGRILGYVEAHPGIHFSALRDALGLANGVTSHHLHTLEKEGRILSWGDGTRRRYAASGIDPATIRTLEHPVTGMQRAILATLSESGELGLSATELRGKLEATRQLMSYHLQRLDERTLVARQGKGRKATWHLTEDGANLLAAQKAAAI